MSEPLRVWRRSTTAPRIVDDTRPLMCGGPDLTTKETEEYLVRVEREKEEAAEREREEEQARKAERHPSEHNADDDADEDPYKAAERYRNDRYAVKLLQQEDSAWRTGGGADSGVLG